jgi:translocation and assembly module TamB
LLLFFNKEGPASFTLPHTIALTMQRIRIVLLWIFGVLLGMPLLLVALAVVALNTGAGQNFAAREVSSLSGGLVNVQGLGGRFPDALRVARIGVTDRAGVWLSLNGVKLDWSPLALIGGTASIQLLHADSIALPRLPLPSPPAKAPAKSGGFSLPVKIDLARLDVPRVELGRLAAGRPAVLHVAGHAQIASLQQGTAAIAIDRLDGAGTYRLDGTIDAQHIVAKITADEPPGGFAGSFAGLPDVGGLSLSASIDGPRNAEATHVRLAAGALRLAADGLIDIAGQTDILALTGSAPAMSPRPDLSWQSIALQAKLEGAFTKPEVSAQAVVQGLATGGARVASFTADASGNRGRVDLHAVMAGLVLPPPKPDLLATGPLDLVAHIDLDRPDRPVAYRVTHPLLTADGRAQTAGGIAARLHLVVPEIAPLVALGNVDLQGRTEAVATLAMRGDDSSITIDGNTDFTGGQAPVPTLLGSTQFGVTARLAGQDFTITRAELQGRAFKAAVTGSDLGGKLDLAWTLAVGDLAAATPALIGSLKAAGHAQGPQTSLSVDADIGGDVGTPHMRSAPLQLSLRASGLPKAPSGTLDAHGTLAGAPVTLLADLEKSADGALHALLRHAAWKSLTADADLGLQPGAKLPTGRIALRMTRLADLAPLTGQPVSGSLQATILSGPNAKIDVSASDLAFAANRVSHLSLTGHVADLPAHPDVDLTLATNGLEAGGISGDARATARGPQNALAVQAEARLHDVAGSDAGFATKLVLDATRRAVTLSSLSAQAKGETLALASPARISFGKSVSVDRLRLSLGQATLAISGEISPSLSLTAALRNVTPDLARPFAPRLQAAGLLTADARITGTPAKPEGTIRLAATGLRMRTGPAASLPPGMATVNVVLQGQGARIDARASAGAKLSLSLNGEAPLGNGPLALRARGRIDATLLNPVLGATGQRAEGVLSLDAGVHGSATAPSIDGTATLTGGEIQDYVQGVRIHDINALIQANGDTIRITNFTGKAGDGTISVSGNVGVTAPGMPVNLHLAADHATPLAADRLTTNLDAAIDVTGNAAADMFVAGRVFLRRTDINIPNAFPPSVAKLNVIRGGGRPPPPAPASPSAIVRLKLTIDAPSGIFVRGHGLDAELGGKLSVAGTTAAPDISGGFDLRRGDFSLAGTTLQFSKGEVSFNGSGVNHAIDPTLDFEADSTSGGMTATLAITGYADAPKIALSSVPALPQDEVLSHLLFGTSVAALSPLQIAEIAAAVAELSGVGGGGTGALGAVRNTLGLDRLNVSGGSGSTGTTVEAGRYVARGVYVGAKEATGGGGGTVAQVQIDMTKHLKATGQVGTGGGSVQGTTPENDTGSTIGLSYRFEY